MARILEQQVLDALRAVKDPDLHRDVVSLNMIRDIAITGGEISFRFVLTTPACPVKSQLEHEAREAVRAIPGVTGVTVKMDAEVPKGKGVPEKEAIAGVKNVIAVSSGKGGVGKSTVAVNLAVALGRSNARVGILDTDVYGPNVPIMLGVIEEPRVRGNKIIPREAHGVKFMSIGLINRGDKPVIMRGPMLHGVVQQFVRDVEWGELDYLVVDMPPGTGDVQLSLAQLVPVSGAVLVTTPQEVALADVRKSLNMFRQVGVPIFGIVENMSYFICPNSSERIEIFGRGGGAKMARDFETHFLGEVPLSINVREGGDIGVPVVVGDPESVQAKAFRSIAETLAAHVSIAAMTSPQLPALNIGG
jgi:ATP-binding protein involved in chromosome partitioning